MKDQDFTRSITAHVSAEDAMEKISQVSAWWAKDFTGNAEKLNDKFTVRFGDTFVKFEITEFIPNTNVVWTVTDCHLPWLADKTEWTGTKVIFRISNNNNETTINFTHKGLVAQLECYDTCIKGWTEYIPGSLLNLLKEGAGQPS